jgi:hypothetical protein
MTEFFNFTSSFEFLIMNGDLEKEVEGKWLGIIPEFSW